MYARWAMGLMLHLATVSFVCVAGSLDAAAARPCTREYRPVCGLSDRGGRSTYGNACMARAAGAKILHNGECFSGPVCILLYDPVCARDAKGRLRDFGSLCEAEAANAAFVRKGTCKP